MSKQKNHKIGNKLYVGMTEEEANKLETEYCVKCKHLVDDHFLPVNTFKNKKNDTYTCRHCECKIK